MKLEGTSPEMRNQIYRQCNVISLIKFARTGPKFIPEITRFFWERERILPKPIICLAISSYLSFTSLKFGESLYIIPPIKKFEFEKLMQHLTLQERSMFQILKNLYSNKNTNIDDIDRLTLPVGIKNDLKNCYVNPKKMVPP
jgi:hypothetical protein